MIAILGAGDFGVAMGFAISRARQPFCYGLRQPALASLPDGLSSCMGVKSIDDAIDCASLVVLALPYGAARLVAAARPDWQGRVLVDCTNPLLPGLKGLEVGHTSSAAEEIAKLARQAYVVKAFSTLSADVLENPSFGSGRAFLPVCGDDAPARARVIDLARLMGFDVVDIGQLMHARYLEPFAMLGIQLAVQRRYGRGFALGVLNRQVNSV